MLMEEMDLWSIVEGKATFRTDPQELAYNEKKISKGKRIILDFVKDHLICHIMGKSAKEMYEALTCLY
jgi:hypothetical protein